MKKILIVVGTRPNFIKVTQFKKMAYSFRDLEFKIVHTGQHYDSKMADVFFEQFDLIPDFFLNISPGSATMQMANIMLGLEELISNTYKPDLMIVVGDVNSTFAAALTANKMGIKIAHLESGLRSFDKTMPEEHNRILTDSITDHFFITEPDGMENLILEGKVKDSLYFVGNTMIDTIVAFKKEINQSAIEEKYDLEKGKYVLMTMHRPATVDKKEGLEKLLGLITRITPSYKIIFPIHPRTLKNLESMGLLGKFRDNNKLILTDPLDYFSFQKLISGSKFIITDSGGIQEESTFLEIPCLTLRPNTERPITCTEGSNTLVPFDIEKIAEFIGSIENNTYKKGKIPELWDGNSTLRIIKILSNILKK